MMRGIAITCTVLACSLATTGSARAEATVPSTAAAAVALGLTPESLAVAGVPAERCRAALAALRDAAAERAALGGSQDGLSGARAALASAIDAAAKSPADAALLEAVRSATAALAAAEASARAAETALREKLAGVLSQSEIDAVRRVGEVKSAGLPAELGAVALSAEELRAARAAVLAERRAARGGEDRPAQDPPAALSHPDVVAARLRLSADRPALESAFAEFGTIGWD